MSDKMKYNIIDASSAPFKIHKSNGVSGGYVDFVETEFGISFLITNLHDKNKAVSNPSEPISTDREREQFSFELDGQNLSYSKDDTVVKSQSRRTIGQIFNTQKTLLNPLGNYDRELDLVNGSEHSMQVDFSSPGAFNEKGIQFNTVNNRNSSARKAIDNMWSSSDKFAITGTSTVSRKGSFGLIAEFKFVDVDISCLPTYTSENSGWINHNLQFGEPPLPQEEWNDDLRALYKTASDDGYALMVGQQNKLPSIPGQEFGGVYESFDMQNWQEPADFANGGAFYAGFDFFISECDCDVKIVNGNIVRAILDRNYLYVNKGDGGGWVQYAIPFLSIGKITILDENNIYLISFSDTTLSRRGRIAHWNGTSVVELFKHDRRYRDCKIINEELFLIASHENNVFVGMKLYIVSDLLTTPSISDQTVRISGGDISVNASITNFSNLTPDGRVLIVGAGVWYSTDSGTTFQHTPTPTFIDIFGDSIAYQLFWYADYDATHPDTPFNLVGAVGYYNVMAREIPCSNGSEWEQIFTDYRQVTYQEFQPAYQKTPQAIRYQIYDVNRHNIAVGETDPWQGARYGYLKLAYGAVYMPELG